MRQWASGEMVARISDQRGDCVWTRAGQKEGSPTETGKHRGLHCSVGDGERSAKKIPCRIAQAGARQAQYRLIYHQKERYEVKAMCQLFGISRAAYYAWVKRLAHPDPDRERMSWVQEAYEKSHRTYGYRQNYLVAPEAERDLPSTTRPSCG